MLDTLQNLMRPPAGMDFDFSQPPGEPALAPAGGVSWRVFANPVALFVGGVTAVLLELAEPSVRSGVWDHSSFQRDPVTRLRRTGFAAMMTVYGPRPAAEKMIAHVTRMHGRVAGTTPDGTAYRADDPRLLDWVHATAAFGFTEAYHRYVHALSAQEKDAAFAEGQAAARLYGAVDAPASWKEWQALLETTAPGLEGSNILADFMRIMEHAAILPAPLRWLQRLLVRAAVEIAPEPVRSLPQLRGRGLRTGEATLVRMLARTAGLLPLGDMPPAQAARRLAGAGGKRRPG
ncbi:oxygenase MpaB family protein [Massilia norwichensis]|uniref:Oxygenase MpaB family protein n=1 Tax=Massilia norwichensis TaxID=1442366 RepID=A0ABT2A3G5_9BURK|nr:oxygenase MpaB family protein [Massilia norwichensis]MCS0588727.1 oxygenase MpaB family protein [Massilia norwichensis]